MSRRPSKTRLFAIGLVGLIVIATPLLLVYFLFNRIERDLAAGERAYERGVVALEAERPEAAESKFEIAVLQANKSITAIEKKLGTPLREDERQQLNKQRGRAFWLKARALRDRAFAQAAAKGEPMTMTEDLTLGVKFRSLTRIPDPTDLGEAIASLRNAAVILTENEEIQVEALRTETIRMQSWAIIERFANQELAVKPDSSRALQQLAQFHYDQPQIDAKGREVGPLPLDKRSEKRMEQAREFLDRYKKSPNQRFWRSAELDAKITSWLREQYLEKGKSDRAVKETKRLDDILSEARKNSRDQKAIAGLSLRDTSGLFYLKQLDLEQRVKAAVRNPVGAGSVQEQLDEILALAAKFSSEKTIRGVPEESAQAAIRAVATAQPVLREMPAAEWQKRLDAAVKVAVSARDGGASNPTMYGEIVQLLDRQAALAGQREPEKRKAVRAQSQKWLADGFAAADKAKLPPERMVSLHALAAERKALEGAGKKELQPHLDAIRKVPSEEAKALADFIEGVSLERQGRLEQARLKIEEAETKGLTPVRADLALANLYLALNRPGQALTRLNRLIAVHNKLDQLPDLERAWAREFIRSREDLDTLRVVATLGSALQDAVNHVKRNPGKGMPTERLLAAEKEANKLIADLPRDSAQRRSARLAMARYQLTLGRRDEAKAAIDGFMKEFPGSIDVLPLRAALVTLPEKGAKTNEPMSDAQRKIIDDMIQDQIRKNSEDRAARLYWAWWLTRSNRSKEAIEYLENPANFPGEKDDRYRTVMALALLGKGDREGGAAMLRQLPSTPRIDAALVQLAGSPAERQKQLDQALSRYDRSALLHCMKGAVALESGKDGEAADAFFEALGYTQVKNTAEAGLGQALVRMTGKDAAAAREKIAGMLKDAPDEKLLYLAYAYASLQMDDIGNRSQRWESAKNMATALEVWEGMTSKETGDRVAGVLTVAEFWRLAGRDDLSWTLVRQLTETNPTSVPVLRAAAALALMPVPGRLAEAPGYIDRLEKAAPKTVTPLILRSRLNSREQKWGQARQTIEGALVLAPDNEEAATLLGEILLAQKEWSTALSHARAWRKRSPSSLAAASLEVRALAEDGKSDDARKAAQAFVAERMAEVQKQQTKAQAPANVSAEEWKKRKEDDANRFELALKAELARPLATAKAWSALEAQVAEVLEKDPDQAAALHLKGDVALIRQDWKTARDAFTRLLDKQPRHFVAANNLAWMLVEKFDEPDKALAVIEKMLKGRDGKAIAAERLPPDALDTIGLVYAKSKDADLMLKMKETFESATQRYPGDPRMSLFLGHAYAGLDDERRASRAYDAAIGLTTKEDGPLGKEAREAVKRKAEEAKKRLAVGKS